MIDKYILRQFLWSWERAKDKTSFYDGSSVAYTLIKNIMIKNYGSQSYDDLMKIYFKFNEWYYGNEGSKDLKLHEYLSKCFEIEIRQPLSANECKRPIGDTR